MTLLDKLLLYLFSATFFTVLLMTGFHNLAASIFVAILLVVLARVLFLHLYVRRQRKSVVNVYEMENALSVMGNEQTDFLLPVVPQAYRPEKRDNAILFTQDGKRILLCPNYKFSPTSQDDAARFFRAAKREEADVVYVLGRAPNRQTMVLANSFDRVFRFIPSKKLHKFLKLHNALMPKPKRFKNPKKIRLSTVFKEAFTKKRAKYFAFSGLCISAFALFTPYRVYYLVSGAICLVLCFVCALRKET